MAVFVCLFLQKAKEVDALGTLNGGPKGAVPDQLSERPEGTTYAEGDSVV